MANGSDMQDQLDDPTRDVRVDLVTSPQQPPVQQQPTVPTNQLGGSTNVANTYTPGQYTTPYTSLPSGGGMKLPEGVPESTEDQWKLLWKIRQAESGNKNIFTTTYGHVTKSGLVDTGSGYYQMIDPTFQAGLKMANLPNNWQRAIDAPGPVQDQVALALLRNLGTQPWHASRAFWNIDKAPYVEGYSGSFGDTGHMVGQAQPGPSLGQSPAAGVQQAQQQTPVNPLTGQNKPTDVQDIRQIVALSMMKSMLGQGLGFQRIPYNPWQVREAGAQSGVQSGFPIGFGGLPSMIGRQQVGSAAGEAATSPRRAGRRADQKGPGD